MFGAYFGLAASFVLGKFSPSKGEKEGSVYHSDIFAMIGMFVDSSKKVC